MLPKYILRDIRQILRVDMPVDDFQLEHAIIEPIYDMVFRYRAGQILKQENPSFTDVVDVLAGSK